MIVNYKSKIFAVLSFVLLFIMVNASLVYADDSNVSVKYRTHVQNYGWQDYVYDGTTSGTSGEALRLEGINIEVTGNPNLGVRYSTHVQDYGWQDYKADGIMSGTEGESKRLEAIKIELTGVDAGLYDVYYRVHIQDYGWLDWAKNGKASGSEGLSKRLEGIEIKIALKSTELGLNLGRPFVSVYGNGDISYRSHVQDYGWKPYVVDGELSGTFGESKRLEAINIRLGADMPNGSVIYSTHVQDYGWLSEVKDGAVSGITGKSKRIEAIKVNLNGQVADSYDIYYRVHVQDYGWLDWAVNGESSGSCGMSKRIEAIEIRLVSKGDPAPGKTDVSFISKGMQTINGRKYFYDTNGNLASKTGIDVSYHQGIVDWVKVKNDGIDFAIIRIGYGNDDPKQDDPQALRNMLECERLGIPYGVYLYSYALSQEEVNSEVRHTLRMIDGRNPEVGVFFDMEDADEYKAKRGMPSNEQLSQFCISYMNQIKDKGYKVGLYASTYWFNNVLTNPELNNYDRWVAQYNSECTYQGDYIMWQYTSKGSVNGVSGYVDMNIKIY